MLALCTAASPDVGVFQFLNKGTVQKGDTFPSLRYSAMYAEPENVTRTEYAWADTGTTLELFTPAMAGTPDKQYPASDLPGSDLAQVAGVDEAGCKEACGLNIVCKAWVYQPFHTGADFGVCKKGAACCFLKSAIPVPTPAKNLTAGTLLPRSFGPAAHPSVGVRTAPPLGGVAAGTVEMRADGSFTAWTMENNSPAGSAKVPKQRKTFAGVHVAKGGETYARVLQTTTDPSAMPAVDGLEFSGSPPVTRLQAQGVPAGVGVSLLGYSSFATGNMNFSHLPAVAFSFEFVNNGTSALRVAGLFHLQGFFDNVERKGTAISTHTAPSSDACAQLCNTNTACATFQFINGECTLQSDSPLYAYQEGTASGTRSEWKATSGGCLLVDKPGNGAMHGNYSLCGEGGSVTFATGTQSSLWDVFAKQGNLSGVPLNGTAPHGAMAVSSEVPAGGTTVVTVVLGYFFPHRAYITTPVGNNYNNLVSDAEDAALTMAARLPEVVQKIHAIHEPILNSSMPSWMRDTLVGTLHHMRSAWWGVDGRWRQWEAYDCVNVDSVHNDGERHVPYMMLFPGSIKSKVRAWGSQQLSNGMIQEQLACGCMGGIDANLDKGCGRIMSDVSSMYIIYILELLKWHNDTDFAREMFASAKKAADWHVSVSTFHGMPYKLETTYDVLAFPRYDAASYSTLFHILAMRAIQELCAFMKVDASAYKAAEEAAVASQESMMWDEDEQFYIAYTGGEKAVFADTFYPQVLAYSLGYGELVNKTRIKLHLQKVAVANDDPSGLKILTGRKTGNTPTEGDVWMMAPADHSTLLVRLGEDFDSAIVAAERTYKTVIDTTKDVWKTCGVLKGNETEEGGMCSLTTHYGYYMTIWHTMLAMTGQTADLYNTHTVDFQPVLTPPFRLPFMLPSVTGVVSSVVNQDNTVTASLCLTDGVLEGVVVKWWGLSTETQVSLAAGECVSKTGVV